MKATGYQATITALCKADGLPPPRFEVKFAADRQWRLDVAFDGTMVALEINGGLFVNGRHSRGAALLKEHEKLNAAAALGWRILFCTPRTIGEVWPAVVKAINY